MMKIPTHAKYKIIYDTMHKNDNLLNVRAMLKLQGYPVPGITIIFQQKACAQKGRNGTDRIFF